MSHNLLFKGVTSKDKTKLMLILTKKKTCYNSMDKLEKNIMKMFEKDLSQEPKETCVVTA